MHRITKSLLDKFVKSYGLEQHNESSQFEMFVNAAIITSKTGGNFELEDITTGEKDDGTDGIAVLIDEEPVFSEDDASLIFNSNRKNHDVEVVFIQSKRSESFDLGDFLKFKESILKFVENESYEAKDEIQNNAHSVFNISMNNALKITKGKLAFTARFITTGRYQEPKEFEDAKDKFIEVLDRLNYFSTIDVAFMGYAELNDLWVSTQSEIIAELSMFSNAALPTIDGIDEAYLVVVKAKEFVNNLLIANDGSMRLQVFEENVRAFLGIDNIVNQSISQTLNRKDAATRFPVLNNGITVVSPDVRVQGNTLYLKDFQIVNGCQTSNVLYENRDKLDDSIMVSLKVVETKNEDVFSDLVRATNSQSKVEETQFYSLKPIVKRIESYFNTYEDKEGRIYFERRHRQYVGEEVPAIRKFSLNDATRCVTSLFLRKPELAYRYRKRMYDAHADEIFSNETKEIIFYASCLALYRLHYHVANAYIPQNMRKYKWHIIVLVGAVIAGKKVPKLNSKGIESYCKKLIGVLSTSGRSNIKPFKRAVDIISSMDNISDDRLKTQATTTMMLSMIDD